METQNEAHFSKVAFLWILPIDAMVKKSLLLVTLEAISFQTWNQTNENFETQTSNLESNVKHSVDKRESLSMTTVNITSNG